MRVLVVEDEARLAASVARGLRQAAHAVDLAATVEAARRKLSQASYDAMVLDVMLPDGSGFSLVEELRAAGHTLPILMLTARGEVEDRVRGLNQGADDYLVKPFALDELLARLRALARRGPVLRPEVIAVADLRIDTGARRAARGELPIELTTTEWALLEYLARHRGQVCSRSQISLHVWDEKYVPFSNVIDAYVARLRRKIDTPGRPTLIHTVRGAGYLLGLKGAA